MTTVNNNKIQELKYSIEGKMLPWLPHSRLFATLTTEY